MATLTTLQKVKLALRTSHNQLDTDIEDNIKAAKLELTRAGVASSAVEAEDELILRAIKTFCHAEYESDQDRRDSYMESFKSQLENLRKSSDYNTEIPDEGEGDGE